ncbi:MAG: hypothetical protein JXR07_05055 [Reichenbachiella sp.]
MLIESIGYFLPTKEVSTDQVVKDCKKKVWIPLEKITGIKSRRKAGDTEFSVDLAIRAAQQCLDNSKYDVKDIDLVLCCNISRMDAKDMVTFEPSTAIKLVQHFGFENAMAFDISNACAGFFTGLKTAQNYLDTGVAKRVLVVSGEYITHLTDVAQKEIKGFRDERMPCLTLGDSGVAAILENSDDPNVGFHDIDMFTYGEYSELCTAGPTEEQHGHPGCIMYTKFNDLVERTIPVCIDHSLNTVKSKGWELNQFDQMIMHQISSQTIKLVKSKLNDHCGTEMFHDKNTISNLERRGNTSSTTHFVAIMDNVLNGRIKSGDKILFSINASGITVGTALYTFDDLPDRLRTKMAKKSEVKTEVTA